MGSLRSLRRKERPELVPPPIPTDEDVLSAICLGTLRELKALLSREANSNARNEYVTALGCAVAHGKLGMVKVLVKHGADVNHRDGFGETPLYRAVTGGKKRSLAISRLLLDHGANTNASDPAGWTPLMRAVRWNQNVELVRLHLEKGADPTLMNQDGKKALDFIRPGENYDALKSLLEPVS